MRVGRGFLRVGCGRGGSVSRRDHNQAYWRGTPLSGGTNSEEPYPAKRQLLFGRGGAGGEVLLLEKQPLPRSSPRNFLYVFLRVFDLGGEETHEGEEGWERRGAVGVCKRGDQQPAAEHKD